MLGTVFFLPELLGIVNAIRSRSCPRKFHCVYCTCPKFEGDCWRLKEPGSIADAMARMAAAGLRNFEVVDSVFNAPMNHAMEVCAALARAKHRARLLCLELNPRDFVDGLMTAMERAGFIGVGITLESASDPVLQGLRKGFTSRQVACGAGLSAYACLLSKI